MARSTVYNMIVEDELWEKVNNENKKLITDFLEYKTSSDKSPSTIKQYESVLRIFFVWNLKNNENKFFVDMKKREFVRFFNYMVMELKSSPNRIINVKATLSSLSNYIETILDDEYEDFRNIVSKIETVAKSTVRKKTIMTQDQVDECLKKLTDEESYQIACFFALAVASGARKAELLRFKTEYFSDDNIVFGSLYKTPEEIKTKGRSSRGKMLIKYVFVKQFKEYFEKWMEFRKENNIDSEWLFVIKRGDNYEQADIHNANSWAKIITKYLGTDFYAHACRHFYVTSARQSGLPDKIIQKLVGWSKESGGALLELYDDSDVEDTFEEYFDENGIKSDIKVKKLEDM